ncbi:hypothetical protein AAFF_G00422420 [Aldrovandia affinis]|uniref:Uncharacterized protein n=1 Tax=Aldrovandia affinis TaxID=143900 RepID=A0AAD7T6K0_9TELE|nr:hypothetical protein AAFF_G00422420 [Aldrovandia affinis]
MAVIHMVVAHNDIRLSEIKQNILDNNDTFQGVDAISTTNIAHILERHQVPTKQIYLVPLQREFVQVNTSSV